MGWWPPWRVQVRSVSVGLPFGLGNAEIEVDDAQRRAAWQLYVELITRISVQSLDPQHGLLREALSSLYSVFGTTREILKSAGPQVAARSSSVGKTALCVLNKGIRPFLSKWHPDLSDWEVHRATGISARQHEAGWDKAPVMRSELNELRQELELYAAALAAAAGIDDARLETDSVDPKWGGIE